MSFTLNITSCTGKIDLLKLLCNEMACFIGKYKYTANGKCIQAIIIVSVHSNIVSVSIGRKLSSSFKRQLNVYI